MSVNSNDNDAPGKHRIGTPVRDLIHNVLGGSHDKDDNDEKWRPTGRGSCEVATPTNQKPTSSTGWAFGSHRVLQQGCRRRETATLCAEIGEFSRG